MAPSFKWVLASAVALITLATLWLNSSNRNESKLLHEISLLRRQVADNSMDIEEIRLLAASATAMLALPSSYKQPEACKLPAMALLRSVDFVKDTACLWTSVDRGRAGKCVYTLSGHCKQVIDAPSGCMFYGFPENEQYGPADFVLPDAVSGQIKLTVAEEKMLRKPFEPCDSRPRFFLASTPLLSDGETVATMGTPEKPLVLMAGGSPGIAQHFYFVLNEVGAGDIYRLGSQKASEIELIVDIGANIGLFSISACLRFPNARILAFEPHPANFRFLKHNLAAAGCEHRVEAHNKGISNDGRTMKIYWHDSIGTSAFREGPDYMRMDTISPESLFKMVGFGTPANVSLLKIDCEGCEYEAVPLFPLSRVRHMICEVHAGTVKMGTNESNSKAHQDRVHETCKSKNPWETIIYG